MKRIRLVRILFCMGVQREVDYSNCVIRTVLVFAGTERNGIAKGCAWPQQCLKCVRRVFDGKFPEPRVELWGA